MSLHLKNIEKILNTKKFIHINDTIYNTRYVKQIKINSNGIDGQLWFPTTTRDWLYGFHTTQDEVIPFKLSDLQCSLEDNQHE